jgi:hypothetical protein
MVDNRVDAPHVPASDQSRQATLPEADRAGAEPGAIHPEPKAADSSPPFAPRDTAQVVQTQAAQLAEYLRTRQQELDHREAALNARAAQLDRDARLARLWLDERMAELEEKAGKATGPAGSAQVDSGAAAEDLARRNRRLDEAELAMEARQAEIEQLYREAIARRQRLDDAEREHHQRLAAEQAQVLAELDARRRAIGRRGEQLDRSRAALEQLRGELGHLHRETLEIRLATEEVWGRLDAAAAPAAVTQSLSRTRAQLAEQYKLANADLQRQRVELEQIRGELAEQHVGLSRRKQQLDQWTAACRQAVQEQATRLTTQSQEQQRREAELCRREHQWQSERLRLAQEVRQARMKSAE